MNKVLLRICLLCLLGVLGASAQIANNTALVGTVVDASGSAVPGAQVTATEQATQVRYTATTNSQGYYSITFIKSGVYDLSVEKGGFKREQTVGVPVSVDLAVRTDFDLKIGSTTETVTITATTAPLSTDDANLGETFSTKQVEDLPVQGHNALEVAALGNAFVATAATAATPAAPAASRIIRP